MVDLSTADTLVLAWHGSRNPAAPALIAQIADRVRGLLPGVAVHVAWVDIEPVLLPQTLAEVGSCTLVPCFLAAGYHVHHDVPEAVASAPGEVRVTEHLGPALLDVACARVEEAGGAGEAVVLAVAGSAREGARDEVARVADHLAERLGVPVSVGNLYQSDPTVAAAVGQAQDAGASDLLVVPWVLAPGRWDERVPDGVRVAAPLGDHPGVARAIAARFRSAQSPHHPDHPASPPVSSPTRPTIVGPRVDS